MATLSFQGSVTALTLYDVSDEINLAALAPLIGGRHLKPAFKPSTLPIARFEQPPVIESHGVVTLHTCERFECTILYYDYGLVRRVLQRPFSGTWFEL